LPFCSQVEDIDEDDALSINAKMDDDDQLDYEGETANSDF
jgi:hypothetical protein